MSVKQLFDMSGKVALITGGSRGLGLQMAEALGEMGAKVIISARKQHELDEAEKHLKDMGIEVKTPRRARPPLRTRPSRRTLRHRLHRPRRRPHRGGPDSDAIALQRQAAALLVCVAPTKRRDLGPEGAKRTPAFDISTGAIGQTPRVLQHQLPGQMRAARRPGHCTAPRDRRMAR